MDFHRAALARLGQERADAVRAAIDGGMSRSDVARALGVSPQAITKLLART
jgi:transposase-like protein